MKPTRLDAPPVPRALRSFLIGALAASVLAGAARAPSFAAEVTVSEGEIELPTYPWEPAIPHPYFRATDSRNIYPYPMLDNLIRSKEPRRWKTVVLENDLLRVVFLPELGGKVYEVLDKTTSKQVFYVNRVVKPGLIGQCGAWVSGGIEFNTGPAGHTVSAVMPVDVEILPAERDGSRSVAVGEVERVYRTRWTVVVTLRPGRSFLEETVRIYNRTETVRPYYFWNCTAMPSGDGFRFIYPMTLGTDHAGTTFYTWPVSDGKDLSLARNYQDASSIFAWGCDQDFFGSYDEVADTGVVACANHHLLPGKKAWTWGRGSYGTMHQMDLTDDDGPYNEVQTGPLLTQADVGRLEPLEAVSWKEWWYPVRGIGGFNFATKDVAVNATRSGRALRLRMMGTGTWDRVDVTAEAGGRRSAATTRLSTAAPTDLTMELGDEASPARVEIRAGGQVVGAFRAPLDLPVRTRPAEKPKPAEASELAQSGWQDILFARFPEAETRFREAIEKDPSSAEAHCGLAFLRLDADPAAAAVEARAALAADPDLGLARHALAVAELRSGRDDAALEEAWKAALDPRTAVPGRALAAKILLRRGDWTAAAAAISEPGPWTADPETTNRLALARWRQGDARAAVRLARRNLRLDPLDALAASILWLAGRDAEPTLARRIGGKPQSAIDLAAAYADLGQDDLALRVLDELLLGEGAPRPSRRPPPAPTGAETGPLPAWWAAHLCHRLGRDDEAVRRLGAARGVSVTGVFPHRIETVPVLRWVLEADPKDGRAALCLGHLLFSLGRHAEGRAMWTRALELGESPAVAARALARAAIEIDRDAEAGAALLDRARTTDPRDPIVAMDLARLLVARAEKAPDDAERRARFESVRATLASAFEAGKGRSDFVALLARAQNRLGLHAETAKLLDQVRITIWEGARDVHDLFEEAHVALAKAHLAAGRPAEALRELDRALEYPENLATGRLEGTREAHIQYLRGNALAALGRRDEARAAWRKAADEEPSKDAAREDARRLAREALEKDGAPAPPAR